MFLKITTPSDETATAVVETAIQCGGDLTEIKRHRRAGTDVVLFTVYLRGTREKLHECRMSIVKQRYYKPESFMFRTASTMSTLKTEEED